MKQYNATLLTIGDELLIGQITDTNSVWLGQQLSDIGISVKEKLTVGDTEEEIIKAIKRAADSTEIVLITGGLGPTQDDRTVDALCGYLVCGKTFYQEGYDHVMKIMEERGRTVTEAFRKQFYLPESCTPLHNRMGTAPGILIQNGDGIIVSMPGVPHEMKALMEDHILPLIKSTYSDQVIVHKTIRTAGMGESTIAELIQEVETSLPEHISLAYLPSIGHVRLRLSGRGESEEKLKNEIQEYIDDIKNILGDVVYGEETEEVNDAIAAICLRNKWTIGTAESCTGGAIAAQIVSSPGSSAYFEGSVVSYSYELKEKLLGIDRSIIETYGAVSEETVVAMAKGAKERLGVDAVVSVSGVAGPSGGTPDKPVGTVWMACYDGNTMKTKKILSGKDRVVNIRYSTVAALNLLRLFLLEKERSTVK